MTVKLRQRNPEDLNQWIEKEIYIDGYLKSNLDIAIADLQKDWDQVWFIDGAEGSGKSVLGITLAFYVSPEERRHTLLDRIIVNIEDAPKVIKAAEPFDAVVIDEGYGGMSSLGSMSKLNRMLQRLFTEIRAKNLFIFVIAPTFMDINRYFAIWRSKCLLNVYSDKGERGYCNFYNYSLKKKLYIVGRKNFYNYQLVKPNFRFRFTGSAAKIAIDFEAYKLKKRNRNLVDEEDDKPTPVLMKQCWIKLRDNLNNPAIILKKPLTQEQYAGLMEISTRNVQYYDQILRKQADEAPKYTNKNFNPTKLEFNPTNIEEDEE